MERPDLPEMQDHAKISIVPARQRCSRFGYRRFWSYTDCAVHVYSSCHHNEFIALRTRVVKAIPTDLDPVFHNNCTGTWHLAFEQFCNAFEHMFYPAIPLDTVTYFSKFKPGRRKQLTKTLKENYPLGLKRRCYKTFLKREKLVKRHLHEVISSGKPRVIQGCPDEDVVFGGPYISHATQILKEIMKPNFSHDITEHHKHFIYTSGLTTSQVGQAFTHLYQLVIQHLGVNDPVVAIADDQSTFDLHIRQRILSLLHRVNAKTFPPHVLNMLERKRHIGRFPSGTKYSCEPHMASGSIDTAYTDTMCNMIMKLFIFGFDTPWASLVCGDDSITLMPLSLATTLGLKQGILNKYLQFGMDTKVEFFTDLRDADFCSGRFLYSREQWHFVPKTGRLLSKIYCDDVNRNPTDQRIWLRSINLVLLEYAKIDPTFGHLPRAFDVGHGATIELSNEYTHKVSYDSDPIPLDDIIAHYQHHYGMDAHLYRDFCNELARQQLFTVCDSPIVNLLSRDL